MMGMVNLKKSGCGIASDIEKFTLYSRTQKLALDLNRSLTYWTNMISDNAISGNISK
jgi:hypothetical protein